MWANPGLFFVFIFGLFEQTIPFLQQINANKCPVQISIQYVLPGFEPTTFRT